MISEAILNIARDASDAEIANIIAGFSTLDWRRIVEISRSLKVAPDIAERLLPLAPSYAADTLKAAIADNSLHVREQLTALKRIALHAKSEGLRFVLVKGLSHAAVCRGNLFSRQTGDIDILVDTADFARCDYVLQKAGFRQPANPINKASTSYALNQAEQYLLGMQRPYPTRPKVHSDQLHPYYASDMLVKVEVHDGLHYIPQGASRHLLWATEISKMGPIQVWTLTKPALLLVLIASTFQNSENIHAKFDGEANLRDYIDLDSFFKRHEEPSIYLQTAKLITQCELYKETEQVLSNYSELFGNSNTPLGNVLSPSRDFSQREPFLARIFNKDAVRVRAIADIKSEIKPIQSTTKENKGQVVAGNWTLLENDFELPLEYKIEISDSHIILSWRLPSSLKAELCYLAFQVGLIPKARTKPFETLVAFLFDDDTASCSWQRSSRLGQKLIRQSEEGALPCLLASDGSFIMFTAEINITTLELNRQTLNRGLGIIPMAFQRDTASEYRAINLGEDCYLSPLTLVEPSASTAI